MKKLPHFFQSEYNFLKWLTPLFVIFLQTKVVNAGMPLFKAVKFFNLDALAVSNHPVFPGVTTNFSQKMTRYQTTGSISIDCINLIKDAVDQI